MIHAYDKLYLQDAQSNLAAMLDYAVNFLDYELGFFYKMFVNSRISNAFSHGDASTIAGKSGAELARIVVEENTKKEWSMPYEGSMQKSPEYWTGWALAYYQWYVGDSFSTIDAEISVNDIYSMYDKYHEMDLAHFVDRINEIRMQRRSMAYLKKLRMAAGLSQSELARQTGIPVKTIQQYEQRQKNINKASFDYIIRLSRALGCEAEMLMEKD